MAKFSDVNLVKKLSELNNTQQSIQTLSLWLIHHRVHAASIVNIWHRELDKAHQHRKLTFVYLANDIIQNSKKKGPEFAKLFAKILPEAFSNAARNNDTKTRQSLSRVLSIWQDRGVYDKYLIKKTRHVLDNPIAESSSIENVDASAKVLKTEEKSTSEKHVKKSKKEPELSLLQEVEAGQPEMFSDNVEVEELMQRLSDLEHSASCDATVRERIAALPLEVSDATHLEKVQDKAEANQLSEKVNDASLLLCEYNQRLSSELDERKKVAFLLRSFINQLKAQLQDTEKHLLDNRDKLARVSTVRQELLSHIQNLPDLTKLPDVTGGLAPLPSAGDLFSLS